MKAPTLINALAAASETEKAQLAHAILAALAESPAGEGVGDARPRALVAAMDRVVAEAQPLPGDDLGRAAGAEDADDDDGEGDA